METGIAVRQEQQYQVMPLQVPLQDVEKMANYIYLSKILGKDATIEQTVAIMLIAQAENRHPVSAAQDYHIIQGRPSLKAITVLARFQAAGGTVEWHELSDTMADATFSHPQGGSLRLSWDIERAKRAGYYDRNPKYKTDPRTMLRSRLVVEGVKAVYSRVLSGMATDADVEDMLASEPRQLAEPERAQPTITQATVTTTPPAPEPAAAAPKRRKAAPIQQPEPEPAPENTPQMQGPDGINAAVADLF